MLVTVIYAIEDSAFERSYLASIRDANNLFVHTYGRIAIKLIRAPRLVDSSLKSLRSVFLIYCSEFIRGSAYRGHRYRLLFDSG